MTWLKRRNVRMDAWSIRKMAVPFYLLSWSGRPTNPAVSNFNIRSGYLLEPLWTALA